MRKTLMPSHAPLLSLALLLSGFLGTTLPAQASTLSDWQYNPENAALAFQIDPGITPRYFLMPNPMRVIVDLPNTALQTAQTDQRVTGDVSRIRVSEFKPGVTRLVMELAPNSVLQSGQVSLENLGNGQWQIRPLIEISGASAIARSSEPAPNSVANPTASPAARPVAANPARSQDSGDAAATQGSIPNALEVPVIMADESSEIARSPKELVVTQELLPSPRPEASALAPLPTPKVRVPVLNQQAPEAPLGVAAADFTTRINTFEPLPGNRGKNGNSLSGSALSGSAHTSGSEPHNFAKALPSIPSSAATPAEDALPLELPTVLPAEPEVPFLVEFGQPLPGVKSQFPAAYYAP